MPVTNCSWRAHALISEFRRFCIILLATAISTMVGCGHACNNAPVLADAGIEYAYEDSALGLESLFVDIANALREEERERAQALVMTLVLDDPEAWFRGVFGRELGGILTTEYVPHATQIGQLSGLIAALLRSGQDRITVERFDSHGDALATGYQARALKVMRRPTALYSVRFRDVSGSRVFHIWSFAYVSGRFRLVGKMKALAQQTLAAVTDVDTDTRADVGAGTASAAGDSPQAAGQDPARTGRLTEPDEPAKTYSKYREELDELRVFDRQRADRRRVGSQHAKPAVSE